MKIRWTSFLLCMLVLLTACGQSAPTWQEQYDLGVRYLSEGNYEEAIIAFTVAIEIDPKRAEAYIGLADAYTGQGDMEKAQAVLEKAIEAVGETEDLRVALDALAAASGPPLNEYGALAFEYYMDEFASLADKEQSFIKDVIAALETNDKEKMLEWTENVIKTLNGTEEEYGYADFDTKYGGYKIKVYINAHQTATGYSKYLSAEIRPENGTGYLVQVTIINGPDAQYEDRERWEYYDYYSGNCTNWQWHGEIVGVDQRMVWSKRRDSYSEEKSVGTMNVGLRDGVTTVTWVGYDCTDGGMVVSSPETTRTTIYEKGILVYQEGVELSGREGNYLTSAKIGHNYLIDDGWEGRGIIWW